MLQQLASALLRRLVGRDDDGRRHGVPREGLATAGGEDAPPEVEQRGARFVRVRGIEIEGERVPFQNDAAPQQSAREIVNGETVPECFRLYPCREVALRMMASFGDFRRLGVGLERASNHDAPGLAPCVQQHRAQGRAGNLL